MNDLVIIQTTQGLANYVLKCFKTPKEAMEAGAVISFDARHNSARWARLAARVFLKLGFKVQLFTKITPTPFVPFAVQQQKAAVGVMITASHNPKEDNGYKVFWSNGPQIKLPHDKNILNSISEHLEPADPKAFEEDLTEFGDNLIDSTEITEKAYYTVLKSLLFDMSMNEKSELKIVYSASK